MLISRRHGFVYLANPKTGTTAIEAAFRRHADFGSITTPAAKHISYKRFIKLFPRFGRKLEIVACVRDPLDTLYSWYRYRQRENMTSTENRTNDLSFAAFVEHWSSKDPPPFAQVGTSAGFILDKDGNIPDITIFRYGGTPSLHDYLEQKVGEPVPNEEVNVSPKPNGQSFEEAAAGIDRDMPKLARAYEIYNKIAFRNG